MRGTPPRHAALLGAGAAVGLGLAARLVHFLDWPPGPWIDEIYFLRASRVVAGRTLAFWRTEPLAPPGFDVDLYPTNLYLFFVGTVDRLAGGGMASLRALSIGSSIVLFFASLLLALEATRERAGAFLPAAFLLATSLWLLVPARWATDVVSASAVLVLAAAAALAAARKNSLPLALLAGGFLGLAQYGYVASRLALAVPLAVLAWAAWRRDPTLLRLSASALLATFLLASPLFAHLLAHPARLTARVGEVSILSKPPAEVVKALAANLVDYAALFTVRGDVIQRHGDPSRPVILPGVAALALAGAFAGLRRGRHERFLLLAVAVFLAGGLMARDAESANASRISPAAPFVLVLAALGGARIVELLSESRRRLGWIGVGAVVAVSGALDLAAFARWAESPGTWFGFDVADRRLAETLAGTENTEIVIHPRACRNVNVTDVLLGRPDDGGRRHVAVAALDSDLPWTRMPRSDVLYVAGPPEASAAAAALGATRVKEARAADGRSLWAVFRIPKEAATEAARRSLERLPLLPAARDGDFVAPEEGVYVLSAEGVSVRRLAAGAHRLGELTAAPASRLTIWGPDGFVLPRPR